VLLTPAVGAVLMAGSTVIVAINARLLRIKSDENAENKPDAKAESKSDDKDEPKPEADDEPKSDTKAESKPEAKADPKPEVQPEAKEETEPEAKIEPMTESKPESQPKAEPKSDAEAEPKPEAKAEPPSDLTPQITERAYELYEKGDHQGDSANQDWEQATQEIQNNAAEAEAKPEAKAGTPSNVTPQTVKRVHELYEELGREDVQAVQELEKSEREIGKDAREAKPQPETNL
jgi:hypothetical protein